MKGALSITTEFSAAFLDGYFEDAPAEVLKHWQRVRSYLDATVSLAEAIQPFALFGCAGLPPEMIISKGSSLAKQQLTAGDCQRAAAAWEAIR